MRARRDRLQLRDSQWRDVTRERCDQHRKRGPWASAVVGVRDLVLTIDSIVVYVLSLESVESCIYSCIEVRAEGDRERLRESTARTTAVYVLLQGVLLLS